MSFGAWRQQLRLGHALEKLAGGDSVTAVAFDSGYAGDERVRRRVHGTFGQTPGQYFR